VTELGLILLEVLTVAVVVFGVPAMFMLRSRSRNPGDPCFVRAVTSEAGFQVFEWYITKAGFPTGSLWRLDL
jgi:hypothetical protein